MSFLFFVLQLQIIILLISKFSCTEDLLTDVDVRVLESRPIKRVSIPGRVKTKIINLQVLASTAVDRGFDPRLGESKDYNI